MGQDRSLVYVRNKKEEDGIPPVPGCAHFINTHRFASSYNLEVDDYTVGFCGKIYLVLELRKKNTYLKPFEEQPKKFCFNTEDVTEFIHSNFKEDVIEYYESKDAKLRDWSWYHKKRFIADSFQKMGEWRENYKKVFTTHECPLFVADHTKRKITYNGLLKEVEFYRMFDPYQAFQELSMYWGSLATPQKPMPEISDETMAEIKGFDKFSFRKDKKK